MLVAVSGGRLRAAYPGSEALVTLAPAGFQWRDGMQTIVIENASDTTFRGVDILVK